MSHDAFDRAVADLAHTPHDLQDDLYKHKIKAQLFGTRPPPRRVGRFLLLDELGQGGMGTVLRAYDDTLDRQVAVKLMHPSTRERHAARILREAQALARLSHPNVVQIYEVGEIDDQMFIAMELVHGETLRQWQAQPHSWRDLLEAYLQAGRGLAAAHAEGLVHRDFKPSNCIRDAEGRVRVLDFGLATESGDSGEHLASSDDPIHRPRTDALPNAPPSALSTPLTEAGSLLGTRAFMAPEQLLQHPADARSDQFSFSVALFEALFGKCPYDDIAEAMVETDVDQSRSTPPLLASPTTNSGVPRRLYRALAHGLLLEPEHRWPSMDALLLELERAGRSRWAKSAPWVASTAGALTLTLAALWPTQTPPQPCRDAHQRLDHIWDDAQRQHARDAILSTTLPYAADTWATVEHALDLYAQDWVHASTAACEATRLHHEQSLAQLHLRERCLDRSRTALSHGVALLTAADPQVVGTAVELVTQLPRLERCADLDALARTAGPKHSPELEQELEQLRGQIAKARSLHTTGKHAQGLRTIAPVVARAEQLGDLALKAEALVVEGELHLQAGDDEHGQALLHRAYTTALEHGADEAAVEAMSRLVYLHGVEQADTEVGLSLGATAEALAARYDPEGLLHAEVLTSIAEVRTQRGELSRARDDYRRALEILRDVRGPGDIALVAPLNGLAQVSRKQGELEHAEALYRQALSIRTAMLGARHSETALLMVNLGAVLGDHGAHRDAEQQYRAALEILREALAPDNRRLAHAHSNLGTLLQSQGRHAEAEDELRTAARIWELAHGPDHPRVAGAHLNLSIVLEAQGKLDDAIEQARRALDLWRKGTTPEHAERTAQTLRNLGKLLAKQGRDHEAEPHYREALAIATRSLGPGHPLVASILNRLGRLLSSRPGDAAEAESMHRRALEIYEFTLGADHLRVAHTLRALAKALVAREHWATAKTTLDRALALYATHEGAAKPEHVADAYLMLAEVQWQQGERQAALGSAARAIERAPEQGPSARHGRAWLDAHGRP